MKYPTLDSDEKKILADIEAGKYQSISDLKEEIKKAREYAKNTIGKTKNINIRLSSKDIQKLKAKALENGMPYQTLISSILHQYINERVEINL